MITVIPWKRNKKFKVFETYRLIELVDKYKAQCLDHYKEMESEKQHIVGYFNELQARAGTKDKEANAYLTKRGWDLE